MPVCPTLEAISEIYRLDRSGGPQSPRFLTYLARVEQTPGLSAYNPMAGPGALETVERLLEIDAEALAARYATDVDLAVIVSSPGLWTDRIATEVELRTDAESASPALVRFWAGEPVEVADVERESAAAAVRALWAVTNGPARTLHDVLAREGHAYIDADDPFGRLEPGEGTLVADAVALLGASQLRGEIASVLLGDPAAAALGWTPLGLPANAGYRWAIEQARGTA
jgi:hypothetical protein